MFKLSAVFCASSFAVCSWMSGFSLPRLTGSAFDYFLMPFLGYLSLFFAAQLATRLLTVKARISE
ncbi:MAG TPA: hypothetical protein VJ910_12615 [Desulfuromonadales bacterium]|nr:hypothetical protein [Desulfuromonadales bacterium]